MGFLKKLGQVLLKATQIITGVGPFVTPTEHHGKLELISDKLAEIERVVMHVEAFGQVLGTPGPDKARAAAPAVAQIILSSVLVGDRKIARPALFLEGATELGGAVAKILNSLDDKVETENRG